MQRICRRLAIRAPAIGALASLCVTVCAVSNLARQAQAVEYGLSPWLVCANNKEAAEVVARSMPLEPASNTTVTAGSPVTFSGESDHPLTFNVASSEALVASPDIDSGLGSLQSPDYKFTSSNAATAPRTIYWTASFTFTPEDCEAPATFTTPVRELTIAPSEAGLAAAKKQQEEQAAKGKLEEEAETRKRTEEAAAHSREEEASRGDVVPAGTEIPVQGGHKAVVKLTCSYAKVCTGKLTLTARAAPGKHRSRRDASTGKGLGSASFSIAAGKAALVDIPLSKLGRALLEEAHGHLAVVLTIRETEPAPGKTQTEQARLAQRGSKGKRF